MAVQFELISADGIARPYSDDLERRSSDIAGVNERLMTEQWASAAEKIRGIDVYAAVRKTLQKEIVLAPG